MAKYLDDNGLLYFWQKIKNTFAGLASPAFTGTPTAPTAASGTDSTQIATTAFVQDAVDGLVVDAYDTVVVGSTSISASTSHQLTIASGDNVQVSGNANNHTVTISATDTTYSNFTGATSSAAGKAGLVPRPAAGSVGSVLSANGTWATARSVLNGALDLGSQTGVLYKSGTNAYAIATAANIVSLLDTTPVNRATADASGNNIADTYALKTEIAGMYKYKGSVASESALPTSGQETGDVYNIESASSYGAAGANVAWNGTSWDSLGEIFTIASITNTEIDAIVAS